MGKTSEKGCEGFREMKFLIVIIAFLVYTLLFKMAAGTLNILKLNMISFAYYLILVFFFIGGSLVYLGFRNHYLIAKVMEEAIINKTYYFLIYSIVIFPLSIYVFNKLMGINNMKNGYNKKLFDVTVLEKNTNIVWVFMVVLGIIGIAAMVYVFKCIGYFPLERLWSTGGNELSVNRIEITREFKGNVYIRNIIMLMMTPMLSYIAYLYMRITKQRKWQFLFGLLFLYSVIAKTYNYEKSPIVWYLFYFYILEILLGNTKVITWLVGIGIAGILIILWFYYGIFGYEGSLFTLSNGPMSRLLISQVATLFLHIQAFPTLSPYLEGASMPRIWGEILGLRSSGVRSGRVVMELFNPAGVANGTAGVMNTFFIGEAYANWGIFGILLAPIYVGFLYSFVTYYFLKQKKTPLAIGTYLIVFVNFSQILLGGFVDYLYPLPIIIMLTLVLVISILKNRGKIKFMVSK